LHRCQARAQTASTSTRLFAANGLRGQANEIGCEIAVAIQAAPCFWERILLPRMADRRSFIPNVGVNRLNSRRLLLLQSVDKQVNLGLRFSDKTLRFLRAVPGAFGTELSPKGMRGPRCSWKENGKCFSHPRTGDPCGVSTCVYRPLFAWQVILRESSTPKPRT